MTAALFEKWFDEQMLSNLQKDAYCYGQCLLQFQTNAKNPQYVSKKERNVRDVSHKEIVEKIKTTTGNLAAKVNV